MKDVARALRATLWPILKAAGFAAQTGRAAWRYAGGCTELFETQSVGAGADGVGCTSFSFSAYAGTLPDYLLNDRVPTRDGAPRPRYYHCALRLDVTKTLSQPWFRPFANAPANPTPAVALHREGLMRVIRRDVHDRPDIWFVREDGSNLDESVGDLGRVLEGGVLEALERLRDPRAVIENVERGRFHASPGSVASFEIVAKAKEALRRSGGRGTSRA